MMQNKIRKLETVNEKVLKSLMRAKKKDLIQALSDESKAHDITVRCLSDALKIIGKQGPKKVFKKFPEKKYRKEISKLSREELIEALVNEATLRHKGY